MEQAKEIWWCASHKRPATHIDRRGKHCCDPALGGILLPCFTMPTPMDPSDDHEYHDLDAAMMAYFDRAVEAVDEKIRDMCKPDIKYQGKEAEEKCWKKTK